MESITIQSTYASPNSAITVTPASVVTKTTDNSAPSSNKSKELQPDQLALSKEAKAKSATAEEQDTEEKKNIDASSLNDIMSPEESAAAEKSDVRELDKRIRELSIEILEISVKIQMLQNKEDKESVKVRQELEVDLAIKKGELEAAMDRKLQMAAVS